MILRYLVTFQKALTWHHPVSASWRVGPTVFGAVVFSIGRQFGVYCRHFWNLFYHHSLSFPCILRSVSREIQSNRPWFHRGRSWPCPLSFIPWAWGLEEAVLLTPAEDPASYLWTSKESRWEDLWGNLGDDSRTTHSRPLSVGEKPQWCKWWTQGSVTTIGTCLNFCRKWGPPGLWVLMSSSIILVGVPDLGLTL